MSTKKIERFCEVRIGQVVYDPKNQEFCVVFQLFPLFHYCPLRKDHELEIINARGIRDRITFPDLQSNYIPHNKILDESDWQAHQQILQSLKAQL